MPIETRFDVPLVASMALREKQIQQNYRPIIGVHKWFARRPGTLFRALLVSEFDDRPLRNSYFDSHDLAGITVADPFMGGGTPLIEANRIGCDTVGFDINPVSAWIVREEIDQLDMHAYTVAADQLRCSIRAELGDLYVTDCTHYGDRNVPVKYFLWVKTLACSKCASEIDLFPGYLLADNRRHPKYVVICQSCGDLNETASPDALGACASCGTPLKLEGPAKRNRCRCGNCGTVNVYPRSKSGPPNHRLFAIEYHNPRRQARHPGRFFKKPDQADLERMQRAARHWSTLTRQFVPEEQIPHGDETERLHRWGYRYYRELFNERQLVGLELSCQAIAEVKDERVRHALQTNLSDLLRYQNMLCRYDSTALKSLDIFSVHGFPVGLVQCESNLLGIPNRAGGAVGSGGWLNITGKYARAKQYCDTPFEVRSSGRSKTFVQTPGEWIGRSKPEHRARRVTITCADAGTAKLEPSSLDGVFTDPPYFGNVQYAELMDFCFVWLRRLAQFKRDGDGLGFERSSTRSPFELTGNTSQAKGIEHFAEGLGAVYRTMALALKPGAPLAFTFHHNLEAAYHAIGVAILDAGLVCTTSLPCPAEMGGSIHIHGTSSSILDTIFVCRAHGNLRKSWVQGNRERLAASVQGDLTGLRSGDVRPTLGDLRCLTMGHLVRYAVWALHATWDPNRPIRERLKRFAEEFRRFGSPDGVALLPTEESDPQQVGFGGAEVVRAGAGS